jgi:hypothetical protein
MTVTMGHVLGREPEQGCAWGISPSGASMGTSVTVQADGYCAPLVLDGLTGSMPSSFSLAIWMWATLCALPA